MSDKQAREFSSPEALKKYLQEHPKADKSKHTVKKDDGGGSKKKPEKKVTPHSLRDKAEEHAKSGKHDDAAIAYMAAAQRFKEEGMGAAAKSMEDAAKESAKKHQKAQKKRKTAELAEFEDALIVRNVVARVVEAGMVAKDPKAVGDWLLENTLKPGQKVMVWTGRGKGDYHEGVVADVKLWPKPGDKAFIRDNISGRVSRKDEYTIKYEREPVYPGEPREGLLKIEGVRSGEGAIVSFGKARERVYKLSVG